MSSIVRIAVVIPGMMGSALSYQSGATRNVIWSEDFYLNYKLLLSNPTLLRWNGNPADAELLERVTVSFLGVTLIKEELWGKLLAHLAAHNEFAAPDRILKFGYDWRQSLLDSAAALGRLIDSHKIRLSSAKGTPPTTRFVFLAHSMGGLVVRVALSTGAIAISEVDRVITIGSPFLGVVQAFLAAYESGSLPMLKSLNKIFNWRNADRFFALLLNNIQSFPSIYQLMPPIPNNYLYYSGALRSNPLQETFIAPNFMQGALDAHREIQNSEQLIVSAGIRAYSIYTDFHNGEDTVVELRPQGIPPTGGYQILEVIGNTRYGDGTVTAESARGGLSGANANPVQNVTHAVMCNDNRVVSLLPGLL